jgi:hypothetical protein
VVDFAAFGGLETLAPGLVFPVSRYDYPLSIAWHGPIIPYVLLAGISLRWIGLAVARKIHPDRLCRLFSAGCVLVAAAFASAGIFHERILTLSKGYLDFFGAFSSDADVAAMTWVRKNTPEDAYILNFPGPQEGDWVPVIAERRSVYYRPQPFFVRGDDALAETPEQKRMRMFWRDPATEKHGALLRGAGISHVIVPQVVGNPASFKKHVRWRRPFSDLMEMQSRVEEAEYLELVFDADGAQVYRVKKSLTKA